MKNIEQAAAVLNKLHEWELFPGDIRVIWLHNKRASFSYSSRKRVDDSLIPQKLADWKKDGAALRAYLQQCVPIYDVHNTDEGFL